MTSDIDTDLIQFADNTSLWISIPPKYFKSKINDAIFRETVNTLSLDHREHQSAHIKIDQILKKLN